MELVVIQLYERLTVSGFSNNQLIFSDALDYSEDVTDKLFSLLQPHDVQKLSVIVKATMSEGVGIDSIEIRKFEMGDITLSAVCSKEDIQTLQLLAKALRIREFSVFTNVDYYKAVSSGKCIVLDDYVEDRVLVFVFDEKLLLDFVLIRPTSLESVYDELYRKHRVDGVISVTDHTYDSSSLPGFVRNLELLSEEGRVVLSPTLFSLESEPAVIINASTGDAVVVEDDEEEVILLDEEDDPVGAVIQKTYMTSGPKEEPRAERKPLRWAKELLTKEPTGPKEMNKQPWVRKKVMEEEEDTGLLGKMNLGLNGLIGLICLLLATSWFISSTKQKPTVDLRNQIASLQSTADELQSRDNYMSGVLINSKVQAPYYSDILTTIQGAQGSSKIGEVRFTRDVVNVVLYSPSNKDVQKFTSALPSALKLTSVSDGGTMQVNNQTFSKSTVMLKQARN